MSPPPVISFVKSRESRGEDTINGHQGPERAPTLRGLTGGAAHRGPLAERLRSMIAKRYYSSDPVENRAPMNKQYNGDGLRGRAQRVQEYSFEPSTDGKQRSTGSIN